MSTQSSTCTRREMKAHCSRSSQTAARNMARLSIKRYLFPWDFSIMKRRGCKIVQLRTTESRLRHRDRHISINASKSTENIFSRDNEIQREKVCGHTIHNRLSYRINDRGSRNEPGSARSIGSREPCGVFHKLYTQEAGLPMPEKHTRAEPIRF